MARLHPLLAAYRRQFDRDPPGAERIIALGDAPRPLHFPGDGIKPFWLLDS
jgi:hypothetical protein